MSAKPIRPAMKSSSACSLAAFSTAPAEPVPFDADAAPVAFDSPNTPTIETLVAHSNAVLDTAIVGQDETQTFWCCDELARLLQQDRDQGVTAVVNLGQEVDV